jgi:hypothetical protein
MHQHTVSWLKSFKKYHFIAMQCKMELLCTVDTDAVERLLRRRFSVCHVSRAQNSSSTHYIVLVPRT